MFRVPTCDARAMDLSNVRVGKALQNAELPWKRGKDV